MRILQTLYDAGGGVPPQLAVTRRLVERGHEVRVLAHDTLRDRVEDAGAEFTPFRQTLPGHDMRRAETDLVRDWEPSDPLEGLARFRDGVLFGPAAANATEVLALLETWRAEAVVFDWLLFGTALAAERAGIPAIALVHLPYPLRTNDALDSFMAPGLMMLNDARGGLGLESLQHWDEQLLRARFVDVLTVPELDAAGEAGLPPNVHYVGPALGELTQDWTPVLPGSAADPLILVSFSTTVMNQGQVASRVLEAVGALSVRVLFTTGPSLRLDATSIPPNVCVCRYAPHGTVLKDASLVVTHAGFGTVQASLAAGVPLVCLPTGRDQPANAARVAELGVGIALEPLPTVDVIRSAVTTALADGDMRQRARALAGVLGRFDGAGAVVAQIEALHEG